MYGHQLRRNARLDRADLWSDVRPGSLYGALHRLAAEGLIEPLRTEQAGNLPARTVYAITGEGLRELKTLRAEALAEVGLRPDPVDLAVAMSADLDEDTLRGFIEDRIRVLRAQEAQFGHLTERAWPDQTVADDLVAEHARLRLQAELTWHGLLLDRIGKLTAESEHAASSAGRLDRLGKLTAESERTATNGAGEAIGTEVTGGMGETSGIGSAAS